ncbi:MAG: hypothetical protein IKJ81_02485 [Bacteroidales bacterium]|nr:hypothetical protein [Bacteroidales bacterium]
MGSKYRARQKRSVPHAHIGDLQEDSGDDGASAFYESPEQEHKVTRAYSAYSTPTRLRSPQTGWHIYSVRITRYRFTLFTH